MFVLRPATESDANELSRVATETFHDGWAGVIGEAFATAYCAAHLTTGEIGAEIANSEDNFFVLATDAATSAIVGYGKLGLNRPAHDSVLGERPVVLQRFYVSAAGRGTGVADELLTACEAEAARRGFATIWLECDPRNERAWRFYLKRDFVPRGLAVYHYPNGINDQIRIMERRIRRGGTVSPTGQNNAS